jgi:hypothetical protein
MMGLKAQVLGPGNTSVFRNGAGERDVALVPHPNNDDFSNIHVARPLVPLSALKEYNVPRCTHQVPLHPRLVCRSDPQL